MTKALADLLEAAKKATPGPWTCSDMRDHSYVETAESVDGGTPLAEMMSYQGTHNTWANACFIAAARNAIPSIRSLVEREQRLNALLTEALKWIENAPEETWGYANDGHARWPLRDELAHKLRQEISKQSTGDSK